MIRPQPHTQPATRRFFYACIAALALLTGCDRMAAVHAAAAQGATSAQAEQRRALAASEICKGKAHEWAGTVLICHQER